jgi:hypothetical protein
MPVSTDSLSKNVVAVGLWDDIERVKEVGNH